MSASPKRKSGWAIIFIAVFFISPFKAIAAKEPIMRVLIANENKAKFRPSTHESIFVKVISSDHGRIKFLNLAYKDSKVK